MGTRSLGLVAPFLKTAGMLIEAMKLTHGVGDLLSAYWSGSLPQEGSIGPSVPGTFRFHGTGCRFILGDKLVEVEFLPGCDELGFDAWRLWCFGTKYLGLTDLNLESIQGELSSAHGEGVLVLRDKLYFIASEKKPTVCP